MSKLPVIQGLWIGERLSTMEQLSIESFIQNGHEYHLYVYDQVQGVPKGTTIKNANSILPRERIFKYKGRDTYAGFSNLFRYKLLLENGGYWCDTDVICLTPFDFSSAYVFGLEKYKNDLPKVNGAVIKAPAGSKLLEYCKNKSVQEDQKNLVWGVIGPELFGAAVDIFKLTKYSLPPEVFYPIEWWNWKYIISDKLNTKIKIKIRTKKSYAIHLWHEMWRLEDMNKNGIYASKCLYEELKNKYLS